MVFFSQLFTTGDRDRDRDIVGWVTVLRRRFDQHVADHRARRRIDRRLADSDWKAGPGHRADAFARHKPDARTGGRRCSIGDDQRTVRDVWVVAGILYHSSAGASFAAFGDCQRKTCNPAAR